MARMPAALLLAGLLGGCGGGAASATPSAAPAKTHFSSNATIFVHPDLFSNDYATMMSSSAAWPNVAAHTQVFGLYAGWIGQAPDAQLIALSQLLARYHMTTEVEAPAMQATQSCGSGVEGYVPYGQSLDVFTEYVLTRAQQFNIPIGYIKVDEPFYFGSVSPDPRACRWPVATVASAVAQYAQFVHQLSPATQVGDVEPVLPGDYTPDVVTAIGQWHDAYKAASGSYFPFYFADLDYDDAQWPQRALGLQSAVHSRGEKFGIIYIGDYQDTSDAQWAQQTVARFDQFQGLDGGAPDYVLFQSWEPHPTMCLPESSATTFTGVINAYLTATGG